MKKIGLLLGVILLGLGTSCTSSKEKQLQLIKENEKKLFSAPMQNVQQNGVAAELIKTYETYAEENGKDSKSPEFLFKAAELNTALGKYNDAIKNYQTIQQKFTSYNKAAESLFLEAFVYENHLQNTVKAKDIYRQFIQKYPNHELTDDAKASINFIEKGLSPEEIVKQFEAQR